MIESASDAYYKSLLNGLTLSKKLHDESETARKAGATKYWYFTWEEYCPVCGRSVITRERMYTPRPDEWNAKHSESERYDYCEG